MLTRLLHAVFGVCGDHTFWILLGQLVVLWCIHHRYMMIADFPTKSSPWSKEARQEQMGEVTSYLGDSRHTDTSRIKRTPG